MQNNQNKTVFQKGSMKPKGSNSLYLVGYGYTVPPSGVSETMKVDDKFGKKARVRAILVKQGLENVFMSLKRTGGGEDIIDKAEVSTLRQDYAVPCTFGGGDWKVTFASDRTDTVKVNLTLLVEYI
jgi:hypothetical protein